MTRIAVYDTTLRDGSQGEGVNFSLQDKLLITCRLDELGIDYVEGGYPLSNPKDAAYFRAVVDREEIGGLVVGLPIHLDGRESPKSAEARIFAAWLAETTSLGVSLYDERFTSVQAEHALWDAGLTHKKRKERRDAVAAQMMLQGYLDAGCPADAVPTALDGGPTA